MHYVPPVRVVATIDKRSLRLLAMLEGGALVQAVLLAVLSFTGQVTVGLLILFTALLGLLTGLNQPIRQSLVNRLVPVADLPPAVAMNAVIFNTARIVGPSIAGFVIH